MFQREKYISYVNTTRNMEILGKPVFSNSCMNKEYGSGKIIRKKEKQGLFKILSWEITCIILQDIIK